MSVFLSGHALVVTTRGVGKLHLLSYQHNASGVNIVGSVSTSNTGVTRFLISFSHHYERYAFYWEGAGEAVYSIATGLERKPVGRSWARASAIFWGDLNTVSTADVGAIAATATDRTNATTIFRIPDS